MGNSAAKTKMKKLLRTDSYRKICSFGHFCSLQPFGHHAYSVPKQWFHTKMISAYFWAING